MPQTRQDRTTIIKQMLETLAHPSKDLTKWEEGFIESITDQFERTGSLSDRQFEILDRIYAERT